NKAAPLGFHIIRGGGGKLKIATLKRLERIDQEGASRQHNEDVRLRACCS
ncbi:Hypothetical predicted protein, partial [Scomber scombrus]